MPEDGLSTDAKGAVRAFLQRSEVRLSTMHRVASALLSGAGLMVLFPAVERDAVIDVLRSLIIGHPGAVRLLMIGAVVAMLSLPFAALWMVLRDLIHFYFHSNHIQSRDGDVFAPRFTLTGLRLPADELDADARAELERARRDPAATQLLVPPNVRTRAGIDQRVAAYGGLGIESELWDDAARAEALLTLAASRHRSLLDEVAKVEHGMARHVLRTQTIVLRYVKALLVTLTTALATYALAAVVQGKETLNGGDLAWLAGIVLIWAPMVVVAVTAPVRWLDRLLRSEGATRTAVSDDRELTRIEIVAIRLAVSSWAAAVAAIIVDIGRSTTVGSMRLGAGLVLVVAGCLMVAALRAWAGWSCLRRLLGIE